MALLFLMSVIEQKIFVHRVEPNQQRRENLFWNYNEPYHLLALFMLQLQALQVLSFLNLSEKS